ncbi:MAG TPA: hypothetical protein PK472_00485 [Pseudomonadota bacterium]|nr:hypothetical protein [Pseudomonadota bacterium]HND12796.1 hypothetical protein [Pseudomonadota bacterium]HNF95929.1 hypothetical protein [Pseudomonadota bacterium]HNN49686.1 hypothetical protein [Pseudomonadota bacterium]
MQTERIGHEGRLLDLVSRRWDKLDWRTPIPVDRLVITESHYMDVESLGFDPRGRNAINRLLACFTCELFIHFERYVIEFLEHRRHEIPFVPAAALDRFVAEEKAHSDAFYRLLVKLRPDLYSTKATTTTGLRFMHWTLGDDAAIALAPVGSFFLLAWLFEEITIYVPVALDKHPKQSAPLVSEVMRLHAKEEQPHVAIDARVLHHLAKEQPQWKTGADTLATLPLLVYSDLRTRTGWQRVVDLADTEIGLNPIQRQRLLTRGPSQSDRMGMASFADKIDKTPVALGSFLAFLLRRQLRLLDSRK